MIRMQRTAMYFSTFLIWWITTDSQTLWVFRIEVKISKYFLLSFRLYETKFFCSKKLQKIPRVFDIQNLKNFMHIFIFIVSFVHISQIFLSFFPKYEVQISALFRKYISTLWINMLINWRKQYAKYMKNASHWNYVLHT